MGKTLPICERLRRGVTWSDGQRIGAIVGEVNDPVMSQAAAIIDALYEALRPFAGHVGKSGELVTLSIGKDTWTMTLTTDDFERARAALTLARGDSQ